MALPSSPHPRLIACLAALPNELNGLRRRMAVTESAAQAGVVWYAGRLQNTPLLLVQTGMGREAAQRAASFTLSRFAPEALVSFGFAGGLSPQLEAGAVLLCQRLYCAGIDSGPPEITSDAALLAAAQAVRVAGKVPSLGDCLTIDHLASQPAEKQALAAAYPAAVLEMESYWVGLACAEHNVPFLGVRAVSDPVSLDLPPLEHFIGPANDMRLGAAAGYFLRHPNALVQMARFTSAIRLAERQLTAFMVEFLKEFGHGFNG